MVAVLNRMTLQDLAKIRLEEAKILLDNGMYDGAYYLCGYTIELALKACIAKNTREYDFPDKDIANSCYTHKYIDLIKTASLEPKFKEEIKKNISFSDNWSIVKSWSEGKRYTRNSKSQAEGMYKAVSDENNGVFKWIKQYW